MAAHVNATSGLRMDLSTIQKRRNVGISQTYVQISVLLVEGQVTPNNYVTSVTSVSSSANGSDDTTKSFSGLAIMGMNCLVYSIPSICGYYSWYHNQICTDLIRVFFFFLCFRAAPVAYGGCQARGQIGAVAAGLCHSSQQPRILIH